MLQQLHRRFRVPVGLWVIRSRSDVLYSPTLQKVGYFSVLVFRTFVGQKSRGNTQCDESFSESLDYLVACCVAQWKLLDARPARKSVHVDDAVSASMREQVGRDILEDP